MKKINSKTKGKTGELEIAHILTNAGFKSRRGQQFSGSPESPDVISEMKGIHFEVKRVESFNLRKSLDQSIRDKGENEIPIVVQRGNRQPWIVVMLLDDFIELYKKGI